MNTKRDSGIKVAAFLVGWMILIFGVITGIIVWNVSQSWFGGLNVIGSSLFFGVILLGLSQIMTYQEQHLNETEELKRMIKDRRE